MICGLGFLCCSTDNMNECMHACIKHVYMYVYVVCVVELQELQHLLTIVSARIWMRMRVRENVEVIGFQ